MKIKNLFNKLFKKDSINTGNTNVIVEKWAYGNKHEAHYNTSIKCAKCNADLGNDIPKICPNCGTILWGHNIKQ